MSFPNLLLLSSGVVRAQRPADAAAALGPQVREERNGDDRNPPEVERRAHRRNKAEHKEIRRWGS